MNTRKSSLKNRTALAKNRMALAAAIAAAVGALAPAPYASASDRAPLHDAQVVTHVRTAAAFDFAAGESPENITVGPDGSVTLSMLGIPVGKAPELVRVAPSGERTVLVTGHAGDAFAGNALDDRGNVYYNVFSTDASRSGVWKLAPGGSPVRLAGLPEGALPNGLAIDPSGRALYVADSVKATVWSVPASGGTATAWLAGDALAMDGSSPTSYGANGLRFHDGAVWISNQSRGTLLRAPVAADGSAGPIRTVTTKVPGIDDFTFLNGRSDVVFAALHATNEIALVRPDGTAETVLTAADGIASPTATAVRGDRLYITDSSLDQTPHVPKLQEGRIDLSALSALSALFGRGAS
ncbi:hypothetical protein [Streptomyces sp. TS71-3]|uniref:hypothetical protein n=1 Tax=Streptomyces sp. TS71-3 TaxID=2733862 RepID=UPI001B01EEF4|nr:hypothetical protein [Streptomyces sp. TS71-3]GHJ35591.1 hypothetical protein Sm713_12000 [Streptomyces sp. TS71-3]